MHRVRQAYMHTLYTLQCVALYLHLYSDLHTIHTYRHKLKIAQTYKCIHACIYVHTAYAHKYVIMIDYVYARVHMHVAS